MMAEAKGEAATIIEQGRSQAEGLQDLVESLKQSGDDAKRLFLLQKLEPLLKMLSDTVQAEVEEVKWKMNLSLATLLKVAGDRLAACQRERMKPISTLTIATLNRLKQLQQSTIRRFEAADQELWNQVEARTLG